VPSVLGLDQLFALFRRKSNFQFSIKAPRAITHEGLLLPDRAQLNDFLRQVDLLGKKLGSILFQLPPSLEFNAGRTTAFLTLFREMHNEDIAFETTARKLVPTWCWRFVYRVSVARVAAPPGVIADAKDPGGWNGVVYFRLPGSPRKYYSAYDSDFLRSLATRMAHLSRVSRSLLWWL